MTKIQTVPWLRIGVESVAIVGSILLAFAIDASWDSHVERLEEQAYLENLQIQFEQTLDRLQDHLTALDRARAATRQILSFNATDVKAIGWEDFAELVRRSFSPGRTNFSSGALEALIASGDLRMITDRELAAKLTDWSSLIAEVYENETWLVENRDSVVIPLLMEHRINGLQFDTRLSELPPSHFEPNLETLYADPRLDGVLYLRAAFIRRSLDRNRILATEGEAILTLIGRNIDN